MWQSSPDLQTNNTMASFRPNITFFIVLSLCIQVCFVFFLNLPSAPTSFQTAQSTSPSTQKKPHLGDGCYHVFLDVGSNIGVHGRFLFEPDKFPESKSSVAMFAEEFGATRDNRDFCVFAFEPNPKFAKRQFELESVYKSMGWRYYFIFAGASNKDGNCTFYHDHMKDAEIELGFSAVAKKTVYGGDAWPTIVPVIRLSKWIQHEIRDRKIPIDPIIRHKNGPQVIMKLDVEGLEYRIFPDLLTTGALCETVNLVMGEFHYSPAYKNFFPMNLTSDGKNVLETWLYALPIAGFFTRLVEISENCITRISLQDDESYVSDPIEYPAPLSQRDRKE